MSPAFDIKNIKRCDISCIILAGGEGKRFNHEDKGLVTLNNKPLIEHIIDCISPQVDDIVISANRNIEHYKKFANNVIEDNKKNFQGPLDGIASCLPECKHEWVLVIPCDIPTLPGNLVEKLASANNKRLIIAKSDGRRQLVFLMHSSLTENLHQYLQQGHQKAMAWIELQNPAVVKFSHDNGEFSNINTPDELAML